MGQDIATGQFQEQDFQRFEQRLVAEMELLRRWFADDKFCSDQLQCGLELEAWLIDSDGLPVPDNSLFLTALDRKWVVPELSKFNFEVNVSPQYLRGLGLPNMRAELRATWAHCERVAASMKHRALSIGSLPTITDSMLCVENMSQIPRYMALNEQVLRLRGGQPLLLKIDGIDSLRSKHHDVMLESAATSLQVHLKVPPHLSVRYYNASIIASALTVALAANAPLLFGKRLWDDTRIAVFEQAVDTLGRKPRVSFGDGFLEHSLLELFERNLLEHRILLPAQLEQAPATMPHVRMHNGTIWNWNRALIGFEQDGSPHLRIEHRPMSASPTIADLFADTTLYIGLVHFLATMNVAPETRISFDQAKRNFYSAARKGLAAEVKWLTGATSPIAQLLRDGLQNQSFEAAAQLGIDGEFLDACQQVISGRLENMQNGAAWQRRKFDQSAGNARDMLLEYAERQTQATPVHTWN